MTRALALLVVVGCYNPSATPPCVTDDRCLDAPATDGDGPLPIQCLGDDFNATLDVARWDKIGASGTVATIDQELELALAPDTQNQKLAISSKQVVDLTDGEVRVELVQPPGSQVGPLTVTFEVEVGASNFAIQFAGGDLRAVVTETTTTTLPSINFDSHRHRHWRIKHVVGMVIFETSSDRANWLVLSTFATPTVFTEARVQLQLSGSTAAVPGAIVVFDNLEMVTPDCPGRPAAPITIDSFDGSGPLANHTGEVGATWTLVNGSGGARVSGLDESVGHDTGTLLVYSASGTPPAPDYDVEADYVPLTVLDGTVGIVSRLSSGNTGYSFGMTSTQATSSAVPFLRVNGAASDFVCDTTPMALVANRHLRMRLRVRGGQLTGSIDGVTKCTGTNTTLAAAGRAGLLFAGSATDITGPHLDNLRVVDALQ